MRLLALAMTLASSVVAAAEYPSWDEYGKANRYKCPGPFDTLATPRQLTLGGKTYRHTGYKLEVQNPDADSGVKLGVISALKDTSAGTKRNLADAVAWFKQQGAEWLVVNGDLALEELDLEDVLAALGDTGLPVLLLLGNSESKGSFARVIKGAEAKYPNLVNGVFVRQIVADDVELWTVSGYHNKAFVHQGAGCLYTPADIDAMLATLKPGKSPVVLVAHGPPQTSVKNGIDWIAEKKNVGDPDLGRLIKAANIPFGLFGHILEAGGVAAGKDLAGTVPSGKMVSSFYLNAGSLSGDPWGMNDGSTCTGMAFLVTIDGGKAKYDVKRFAPMAAE